MRLAQFNALCEREWASGHGDVTALHLTGLSLAELAADVLMDGFQGETALLVKESEVADITCGAAIRRIRNPLTKTVVELSADGGPWDSAEVRKPIVIPVEAPQA